MTEETRKRWRDDCKAKSPRDYNNDVETVKHYLEEKIEGAYPNSKPEVIYRKPGETTIPSFTIHLDNPKFLESLPLYNARNDANPRYRDNPIDKGIKLPEGDFALELERVFPRSGDDAGVLSGSISRAGRGFVIFGSPTQLISDIRKNDPEGWNKSLLRSGGMSLG